MIGTFLLYLIALCNIHGNSRIEISPETRYTIIINGNVIKENEQLPAFILGNMSEEDLNFVIEDPEHTIKITVTTE